MLLPTGHRDGRAPRRAAEVRQLRRLSELPAAGIICLKLPVVKTLHNLEQISAVIATDGNRLIPFERCYVGGAAGLAGSVDPQAAVRAALARPLDFPPLSSATVPGDRVAIAVDEAVPCLAQVVRGVVELLADAGIDDDAISIVARDGDTSGLCRAEMDRNGTRQVNVIVHDADDEHDLCLVGVTARGQRLVINRTIFDADVVLPIGCARVQDEGLYDSLYPRFSDAASIARLRTAPGAGDAASRTARTREADEAGRLVAAPLVMQVVPGAGEAVAHVVAGEPRAVADNARNLCRERWALRSPRRASLVIATVTGRPSLQNWNNIARGLAAAEPLVADGGAIALCSNLDQPLGKSLGRLVRCDDLERVERRLLRDHAEDCWAAWQLARALQRGPVYFLSQMEADAVEDIGLAPVAHIEELARLASRHDSVAILSDSQHALVTVAGEDDER